MSHSYFECHICHKFVDALELTRTKKWENGKCRIFLRCKECSKKEEHHE